MKNEKLMEHILCEIKKWFHENGPQMSEISDKIWEVSETKFNEYQSVEILVETFEKNGFTIKRNLVKGLPTAFVAEWSNGNGPVIALLGEYDALPGLGNELVPEKKPNGKNGHGCGHNLLGVGSMAAALSAAEVMSKMDIRGTIRYFGCPAEEGGSGKVYMVRDNVFDGIDAIVRWHPINATYVSMASALANLSIKYEFHGKSAHAGATPHLGRSALDGVILMDVAANYLREHIPTSVRLHSVITNGGMAPNIVPDLAEIWYYIRAPKRAEIDEVAERMAKIAEGAAMATGTTVTSRILAASSEPLPNRVLCNRMLTNLLRVGPPEFSEEEKAFASKMNHGITPQERIKSMRMFGINDPSVGNKDLYDSISTNMCENTVTPYSTDSGDVSWQAPMCQLFVAAQPIGTANHSWQQVVCSGMGIGHKAMFCAGQTIAMTALDILTDSDLLNEAKAEFRQAVNHSPYFCPLPADLMPGSAE